MIHFFCFNWNPGAGSRVPRKIMCLRFRSLRVGDLPRRARESHLKKKTRSLRVVRFCCHGKSTVQLDRPLVGLCLSVREVLCRGLMSPWCPSWDARVSALWYFRAQGVKPPVPRDPVHDPNGFDLTCYSTPVCVVVSSLSPESLSSGNRGSPAACQG